MVEVIQVKPSNEALWDIMLPPAAHDLLHDGAHQQHVRDLYLPTDHKLLAVNLSNALVAESQRTTAQVKEFYLYFDVALGPREPGGVSLFDRAFGPRVVVDDIPNLQRLNRIIQGTPANVDLPIETQIRVLKDLLQSAYLVVWTLIDEASVQADGADRHVLDRYRTMWATAAARVRAGEL